MKLQFIQKKHETSNIWSFWFKPLEETLWMAGQSVRLEIPAGYDTDERRFTIASAPHEKDLLITTRLSGSVFKNGLAALQPGTLVDAFALEGDFVWNEAETYTVFIAAGIGITPFRSMLLQRENEKKPLTASLIYAAHSGDILYGDTLAGLRLEHKEFTLQLVKNERITTALLYGAIPDIQKRKLYISGPARMVDQLSQDLWERGIPRHAIYKDRFTGNVIL